MYTARTTLSLHVHCQNYTQSRCTLPELHSVYMYTARTTCTLPELHSVYMYTARTTLSLDVHCQNYTQSTCTLPELHVHCQLHSVYMYTVRTTLSLDVFEIIISTVFSVLILEPFETAPPSQCFICPS